MRDILEDVFGIIMSKEMFYYAIGVALGSAFASVSLGYAFLGLAGGFLAYKTFLLYEKAKNISERG